MKLQINTRKIQTETNSAPHDRWKNQRKYLDWIAERLNVTKHDDWYRITGSEISKIGSSFNVLENFHSSLLSALHSLYPEFGWDPLKFSRVPQGFWKDSHNQRKYFDFIGE